MPLNVRGEREGGPLDMMTSSSLALCCHNAASFRAGKDILPLLLIDTFRSFIITFI